MIGLTIGFVIAWTAVMVAVTIIRSKKYDKRHREEEHND